jgi:hypothetical protein
MSKGSYSWALDIVRHTGRKVTVLTLSPSPETLAAIRQVAARYGIPADVTGILSDSGRPADRGLYEDPGGQAGLRYWDGKQWSPLLPPDVGKPGTVGRSHRSWSALPTAEGRWTGREARRLAVQCALRAAVSAALLAWPLLSEFGLYPFRQHEHVDVGGWLALYLFAVLFALGARRFWRERRFLLKLDDAANGSAGSGR